MTSKYSYDEGLAADNSAYNPCPMCGVQESPPESQIYYRDAVLLRRIFLMLQEDVIGADSLFLRGLGNWTLEQIGQRHGITRQAVEQREQHLADTYPSTAGLLLDLAKRRRMEEKADYDRRIREYSELA